MFNIMAMRHVLNQFNHGSLDIAGPINGITSYQEVLNWQDFSEVKMTCAATEENISLLQAGGGILSDDSVRWKNESVDIDGNKITVRGIDAVKMHNYQSVRGQHNVLDPWQSYLKLARGTTSGRDALTIKFPSAPIGTPIPPLPAPMQISWGQVGDALIKMALAGNFGYAPEKRMSGATTGWMISEAYAGIDRTLPQNITGIFSDQVDNIDSIRILDDVSNYKNFAVIAGEGEGAARIWTTVDARASSTEMLRELYVDARDLQKRYTIVDSSGNTSEGVYTDAEYLEVLRSRGREKLAEAKRKDPISIKATESSIMQYGIDYKLGDIVALRLEKYGLNLSARVSSIYTVLEGSTKTVTPSLSNFTIVGG